ncbi:MAG: autotransporter outer membrane beta-barrel domain-containing protein [Alphaproteobacteria bacterium]
MNRLSRFLMLSSAMVSVTTLSAFATNECGTISNGGTANCQSGVFSNGIIYRVYGATINLSNGTQVGTANTPSALGVASGGGSNYGNLTINAAKGSSVYVSTDSNYKRGLQAITKTGNVMINSAADVTVNSIAKSNIGLYGETQTADGGNITLNVTGGNISTSGEVGAAIASRSYNGAVGVTNINVAENVNLTTTGVDAMGIRAQTQGTQNGTITLTSAATINTSGSEAYGIYTETAGTGNPGTTTITNDGTIITTGGGANGIKAEATQSAVESTLVSVINNGEITTNNSDAEGILGKTSMAAKGDIYIENNGSITGNSEGSDAILAQINNSENTGEIYIVNNGTIHTAAGEPYPFFGSTLFPAHAHGISIISEGSGAIQADVNGEIDVATGAQSSGVDILYSQGNDVLVNANADITAAGWDGDGVRIEQEIDSGQASTAIINVTNGATVTGKGNGGADGLQVYLDGNSGSTYDINVIDGTVVGGQDSVYIPPFSTAEFQFYGTAIQISAPRISTWQLSETGGPDGTIDISANGTLNGSLSGTAIRDSDGNMTLTTQGHIIGDILAQDGSDVVNYKGGLIEGVVDGGDDWLSRADGFSDQFNIMSFTGNAADLPEYINFEDVGVILGSALDFGNAYAAPQAITYTIDESSKIIMTGGGSGDYTIDAGVENNGVFDFADGHIGDHLTITGNGNPTAYAAAIGDLSGTGTYIFDTDFNDKLADYITVNGNVTADGTIAINDVTNVDYDSYADTNIGMAQAAAAANGKILLVEAPNDADKSDENFVLTQSQRYEGNSNLGLFANNPFVWSLETSGNDWVLTYAQDPRDPKPVMPTDPKKPTMVTSDIPAYVALPTIGREIAMNELDTLHQRLGELRNNQGWVGTGASNLKTNLGQAWHNAVNFDDTKANAWLRGTLSHLDLGSDNSYDLNGTYGGFNFGIDKKFELGNYSPDWVMYGGLFGGYKTGDFETNGIGPEYNAFNGASIGVDTWSIGAYATFFSTAGSYLDFVAEYIDFNADVDAHDNVSVDGYALAGSLEVGHSFDLAKNWIIEPQAQVKLAHVKWNDFRSDETDVSIDSHTYITGRLGIRTEKTIKTERGEVKPYLYLGMLHEFTNAPEINYGTLDHGIFEAHNFDTAGEIRAGVTADLNQTIQLYGDIGYITDFSDYQNIRGDLGVRIRW